MIGSSKSLGHLETKFARPAAVRQRGEFCHDPRAVEEDGIYYSMFKNEKTNNGHTLG